MCKLLMIPYVPPGKSKLVWDLVQALSVPMTAHDKDGYGYAAISEQGKMFAEKWKELKLVWRHSELPADSVAMAPELEDSVEADSDFLAKFLQKETPTTAPLQYGPSAILDGSYRPVVSIMAHSRWSTAGGGIENSHPFVAGAPEDPYCAFVHNGVVNKTGLRFSQSTCDSEGILNSIVDAGALEDPGKLQEALTPVVGYYAYGLLTWTKSHGWVMDVVKDNRASLSIVLLHELEGTPIFLTDPTPIFEVCKALGLKRPGKVARLKDNRRCRFEVKSGKLLVGDSFKPTAYTMTQANTSHAAGSYSKYYCRKCRDDWGSQQAADNCSHRHAKDLANQCKVCKTWFESDEDALVCKELHEMTGSKDKKFEGAND